MASQTPAPWAPDPADEPGRALVESEPGGRGRLRRGRVRLLCEDGFCLGVLRLADGDAPYRSTLEAICPVCGRRSPFAGE